MVINDALITSGIFLVSIGLFAFTSLRPDLVSLLTLIALGFSGVLTPEEVFSGFSRSAVITIMAVFILADGLRRTGVTDSMGHLLQRAAGASEKRLIALVMSSGAFLSLFMNNVAAASVLLPAVSGAAKRSNVSPSRLLMPLAFATILGGMATLFTTANILISGLLEDAGFQGFGVLDFLPVGVPIVISGVLFIVFIGRRFLPKTTATERIGEVARADPGTGNTGAIKADLVGVYGLGETLFRVRLPHGSKLLGSTLSQSRLREDYHLSVLGVERNGEMLLSPSLNFCFNQGDILVLKGNLDNFRARDVAPLLEILPPREWRESDLESSSVVVVEIVLSPRSRLIGQTVLEAHFRERYGMNVIAIWHAGEPQRTGLKEVILQFGDALLLQGPRDKLSLLKADEDFILLSDDEESVVSERSRSRAWLAIGIVLLTVAISALGIFPIGEVMLAGMLAMVLTRILTMDQAYDAIDWRSVFLVAGMLPLGMALTKTGVAAELADSVVNLVGGFGPWALMFGLYLVTVLLTQTMSGGAAAAAMAPIAIQTAHNAGLDPRAMAMGVTLGASIAFISPLGHPVHSLVLGAGGYTFRDYFKVGFPLTVLITIVIFTIMPFVWPLN